jgi:hypothetical protein
MAPLTTDDHAPILRFMDMLFPLLVTLTLGTWVARHWQGYIAFDKFFAIFVLIFLLAFPWLAIRRERELHLWQAYLLVLLATLLFH